MPTGYTQCVLEGASFEEFVWGCARAMGALVAMRDEPFDARIDLPMSPNLDYYETQLAKAEAELAALEAMTPAEAHRARLNDYSQAVTSFSAAAERIGRQAECIQAMIDRVSAWEPPTPNHANFKAFMLEQLRLTLDADGRNYLTPPAPRLSTERWRAEAIASQRRSVEYYRREIESEIRRTAERNAWLLELRDSVPMPERRATVLAG